MIFLTVGTWYKGYDRLVEAVDELVGRGVIRDTVTAQIGYGSYKPKNLTTFEFCSPGEFTDLISRTQFVISHAGMGTIIETLKQDKPIIVVPRLRAMGEVSNDHQFTTAKQLEAEGKILVAYTVSELPAKIKSAQTFVLKSERADSRIVQEIQEFVESLNRKRHNHSPATCQKQDLKESCSAASASINVNNLLDSNVTARAIAIILIVLAHVKFADPFWMSLGPFMSAGKIGVSLFVFYSGLLHQFQSSTRKVDFKARQWLTKRMLRLYPSYWIGLLLTMAVAFFSRNKVYELPTIVVNVLGIQLFSKEQIITSGYARPYWFLSLIILCYLLFIGLRKVRQKGYLVLASTMFSLSVIYFCEGKPFNTLEHYLALLAFPMFFWGMWIADLLASRVTIPGTKGIHCLVAILLFGLTGLMFKFPQLLHIPEDKDVYVKMIGLIPLNLTIIPLSLCITHLFKWLNDHAKHVLQTVSLVGTLSFAMYCLQEPLLVVLERIGQAGHPLVGFLSYSILLFLSSWALNIVSRQIAFVFSSPYAGNKTIPAQKP